MKSPLARWVRSLRVFFVGVILTNPMSPDDLLLRLDFRDPEPEIIDLSPEGKVVSTLQEAKIECLTSDKVHVFLSLHPNAQPDSIYTRMFTYTTSFSDTQAALSSSSPQ